MFSSVNYTLYDRVSILMKSGALTIAVELELIVTALFDGGDFTSVSVTDPAGKQLLSRTAADEKMPVPAWFINSFPIQSAPGTVLTSWHNYTSCSKWKTPRLAA